MKLFLPGSSPILAPCCGFLVHKWNSRLVAVCLSWHVPVSASLVKSLLEVVAPVYSTMRAPCCIYWTCFATYAQKIYFVPFYHKKEGWRTMLCNKSSPLSEWDYRTAGVQGTSLSYELLSVLSSTYNMLNQVDFPQPGKSLWRKTVHAHGASCSGAHYFCCAVFWCWTLCPVCA